MKTVTGVRVAYLNESYLGGHRQLTILSASTVHREGAQCELKLKHSQWLSKKFGVGHSTMGGYPQAENTAFSCIALHCICWSACSNLNTADTLHWRIVVT